MSQNIEGLNKEESEWVCNALLFILGDKLPGKTPSNKAFERFEKSMKEAGY